MELGNTIRSIRVKRNLTQQRLAELSKTSILTISKIERGITIPGESVLNKICSSLDIDKNAVFFLSISLNDVQENKKEAFSILENSLKDLIETTYDL